MWGFEPKTQSDNLKNYTHLELMVYGAMSGIHVIIENPAGGNWIDETIPVSAADAWQKITIPLPESGEFTSVLFFPNSTVNEPGAKSYYDNIRFRVAENYMLIADFDTKVLYDESELPAAPAGSFKVYSTQTVEQPVDNPDKTAPNTSDKVMKFDKGAAAWQLFGLETKGKTALDISHYTRFEFKVKGNVSELYVQFPEFEQSGSLLVDSRVNVSIDNEWTIFSLDLSGKSGKFSNINIFPNPTEETGATFYFDDFRLYESNITPPGKETSMIFDFENTTLGWGSGQQGYFAFNSDIVSIEENPDPVDPNTSSKVLYWKKDAAGSGDKAWGGYGFPLSKSYDLTKWTHFVFDVYAEKAVTKASVAFSMKNGDDPEISKGQKTDFTLDIPAEQWTTVHLELDVSKLDLGDKPVPADWLFNQFILFIGCNEIETFDVYTDNIRLEKIEYITPDTPLNLQYKNRQETSFDLSWDPVSNVEIEKYLVYRSSPGGTDANVLYGESALSSMSVTGLTKGKDYYFAVKAVSVQGKESELSAKLLVPAFITVDESDISSFAVYPNPVVSGGRIYIGGVGEGQVKVSLYTASGALVKREILSSPYFLVTAAAGNYFLQIESPAYKGTYKLVVLLRGISF